MPFLHRMINLEELDLNMKVKCYKKFIDGDTLMKDIIIYTPRLYKFTFSICSTIKYCYQTYVQSNEDIQKTFEYFCKRPIITCIDDFNEKEFSQCHIYSYPYEWDVYDNITNNFPGGIFDKVTEVSLRDERPFEYEFFVRIAQSFPFMRWLTINNKKPQNNKQVMTINNDNQTLPIIEYFELTQLDLSRAHDDYVELFLFNTNVFLPKNLHLRVAFESLKRVTYNFTRSVTRSDCPNLAILFLSSTMFVDEHVRNYFPHTCMREYFDSVFSNKIY